MEERKRKTHTSTAVKNRYNKKTYDRINISLPKAMSAAFKSKCAELGVSQTQIIKKAIEDFLNGE